MKAILVIDIDDKYNIDDLKVINYIISKKYIKDMPIVFKSDRRRINKYRRISLYKIYRCFVFYL